MALEMCSGGVAFLTDMTARNGTLQMCAGCDTVQPFAHRKRCQADVLAKHGVKVAQPGPRKRNRGGGADGTFEDAHVHPPSRHADTTGAFYQDDPFPVRKAICTTVATEEGEGVPGVFPGPELGGSGPLAVLGQEGGGSAGGGGSSLALEVAALSEDVGDQGGEVIVDQLGGGSGGGSGWAGEGRDAPGHSDDDSDGSDDVETRADGSAVGFREEGDHDAPDEFEEDAEESDSELEEVDSDEDGEQGVIACHPTLRVPLHAEMVEAHSRQYLPRRVHAEEGGDGGVVPFLHVVPPGQAVVLYGDAVKLGADVRTACANLATRGLYGRGALGICNLHCAGKTFAVRIIAMWCRFGCIALGATPLPSTHYLACRADTDPYNTTTRYCKDPACEELRAVYDHALEAASEGAPTTGRRVIRDCHGVLVNAKKGLLSCYDVHKLLHAFENDQSAKSFEHWSTDHPLVHQKCQRTLLVSASHWESLRSGVRCLSMLHLSSFRITYVRRNSLTSSGVASLETSVV